jgi:hypothetical protein
MARRTIPFKIRKEVIERVGTNCVKCGREGFESFNTNGAPTVKEKEKIKACLDIYHMTHFTWINRPMEFDHVLPLAMGGTDDVDNLQILCRKCNRGKRDRYKGVTP